MSASLKNDKIRDKIVGFLALIESDAISRVSFDQEATFDDDFHDVVHDV